MTPQVRDAITALRLLRARLGSVLDPISQVVIAPQLDTIESGLDHEKAVPARAPAEPAPATLTELERDVVRAVLHERELRLRLRGAPRDAQTRELVTAHGAITRAVEALADAEERALALRLSKSVGGSK